MEGGGREGKAREEEEIGEDELRDLRVRRKKKGKKADVGVGFIVKLKDELDESKGD